MISTINIIGIITPQLNAMTHFYNKALGFKIKTQLENFVEFENEGVRFALSTNDVMFKATGDSHYKETKKGHCFELGFEAESPEEVDKTYQTLLKKGAKPVKQPDDMPWGQRTAFFADPDGNVHEIFADLNLESINQRIT